MNNSNWWRNAVVYQIYPKSFQDSNGDGIGDIQGIISRLDYLSDLGVDVLWLSPIYQSPQVDNGYDISDYQSINPDFGTLADVQELIRKAHKRNIKIMMDLVVNHTSDQHAWFQESHSSVDSDKRDWYIWRDPSQDGTEPNNWGSFFAGSAWQRDESSGQYYLHLYAKEMPDLNWQNPQVRHAVYEMMNWWVALGVDGFRMDVINEISKPEGLPDAPKNEDELYGNPGLVVDNGPHIHEYLQEMNQQVLSHHELITVGETPGVSVQEAQQYATLKGTELNMVFQFEHMGLDNNENPALGRWSNNRATLTQLRDNLTKWQQGLHGKAWNSLYWNNHDQPRVVSRFGDTSTEEYRKLSATMLATMLHMMQGTPYIYEGEEIGMTNADFTSLDQYNDLDSINAFHQIVDEQHLVDEKTMMQYLARRSRDNARTPMQWDASEHAGFTTGTPWLSVNSNASTINVEQAKQDPHSVLAYYKRLIELRHHLDVIVDGDFTLLEGNNEDEQIFAYQRNDGKHILTVLLNFTNQTLKHQYRVPEGSTQLIGNYDDSLTQILRPYEAQVYYSEVQ